MKILLTGLGITGKSTLRRRLMTLLQDNGVKVAHFDADKFKELRHEVDASCAQELPETTDDMIWLIEDVHGPTDQAKMPLGEYDLIIYLNPTLLTHLLFWLPRAMIWFKNGNFAWEAETGWQGTGVPLDHRNFMPIVREVVRVFLNRNKWLATDLWRIAKHPHLIIQPKLTVSGIKFQV